MKKEAPSFMKLVPEDDSDNEIDQALLENIKEDIKEEIPDYLEGENILLSDILNHEIDVDLKESIENDFESDEEYSPKKEPKAKKARLADVTRKRYLHIWKQFSRFVNGTDDLPTMPEEQIFIDFFKKTFEDEKTSNVLPWKLMSPLSTVCKLKFNKQLHSYTRLKEYLSSISDRDSSKTKVVFTKEDIDQFICDIKLSSPYWLVRKAVTIIVFFCELDLTQTQKLTRDDIVKCEQGYFVTVPSKYEGQGPDQYLIPNEKINDHISYSDVINDYFEKVDQNIKAELRDGHEDRVFFTGNTHSFRRLPMGKNVFCDIPHKIAKSIGKPNPEDFKFSSIRKSEKHQSFTLIKKLDTKNDLTPSDVKKVFTKKDIDDFICDTSLSSPYWLVRKAIAIFAFFCELNLTDTINLRLADVVKSDQGYVVFKNNNSEGKEPDQCLIPHEKANEGVLYTDVIKEYFDRVDQDIKLEDRIVGRVFYTGTPVSFTRLPMGKNAFAEVPHKIAEQLGKLNTEDFVFSSLRRGSKLPVYSEDSVKFCPNTIPSKEDHSSPESSVKKRKIEDHVFDALRNLSEKKKLKYEKSRKSKDLSLGDDSLLSDSLLDNLDDIIDIDNQNTPNKYPEIELSSKVKSKKYYSTWRHFCNAMKGKVDLETTMPSEDQFMDYFKHNQVDHEGFRLKSATIRARFSHLSTICKSKYNQNLNEFSKLKEYFNLNCKDCKDQTPIEIFTKQDIDNFICDLTLSTPYWLVRKVIVIFAFFGELNVSETQDLRMENVIKSEDGYTVYKPNKIECKPGSQYLVPNEKANGQVSYSDLVKEYFEKIDNDIKPDDRNAVGRVFYSGHNHGFYGIPLGKNVMCELTHLMAEVLKKPNPDSYTFTSLRKSKRHIVNEIKEAEKFAKIEELSKPVDSENLPSVIDIKVPSKQMKKTKKKIESEAETIQLNFLTGKMIDISKVDESLVAEEPLWDTLDESLLEPCYEEYETSRQIKIKSKSPYEKAWRDFQNFLGSTKNINKEIPTEDECVRFLQNRHEQDGKCVNTLWTIYSKVNFFLKMKHNTSMRNYPMVLSYLKSLTKEVKSTTLFTTDDIDRFLSMDHLASPYWMARKVVVMLAVFGGMTGLDVSKLYFESVQSAKEGVLVNNGGKIL